MLDCLILGDSIAIGTHQYRQECSIVAKIGINSYQFNKTYQKKFFSDIVIISLGSNDHSAIKTRKELEDLRARILARNKVFWILPAVKPHIQNIVFFIAENNGDTVLQIQHLDKDGVHPSRIGYAKLGSLIN